MEDKKIGIVTHPLYANYGGVLQAVALYKFLEYQGFDVVLINKQQSYNFSILKDVIVYALQRVPLQNLRGYRANFLARNKHKKFIEKQNINISSPILKKGDLKKVINDLNIAYAIVGSDQVWRWSYIKRYIYEDYFLRDLNSNVKKIAYAASFGINNWEAPDKVDEIKKCLKDFKCISVRESSGIGICKDVFGVENVEHVLDPTILIGKEFFHRACKGVEKKNIGIFSYILDINDEKKNIIESLRKKFVDNKNISIGLNGDISIEEWISNFRDASIIITDSFHGMIFSLIFEKNFYVIPNQSRGVDRFDSMLSILNLDDRKIKNSSDINFENSIDYRTVNKKVSEIREVSKNFILNALND